MMKITMTLRKRGQWRAALLCLLLAGSLMALRSLAADEGETTAARQRNLVAAGRAYTNNLQRYRGKANMLVLPGLLANKSEQWIRLDAEATAIADTEPIEFLLVAENSGHDYEAMAVSFAKPSHLHRALEFLGMTAGLPVDFRKGRLWPKGERVKVSIEWKDNATGKKRTSRIESLILDKQSGKTMSLDGHIFVGSQYRTSPAEPDKKIYAADEIGPNSMISSYNESQTVLDHPVRATQDAVYGRYLPNPAVKFGKEQPITCVIRPEHIDGTKRVVDLALRIGGSSGTDSVTDITNLVFTITRAGSTDKVQGGDIKQALATFEGCVASNRDPYVAIEFDSALSLGAAHNVSVFLAQLDRHTGIRIEPPRPGHLYYKAFIPDERYRDSKNRTAQPWELRLISQESSVSATLTLMEDVRKADGSGWTTTTRDFSLAKPDEATVVLNRNDEKGRKLGLPVVYVYAPRNMTYGQLSSFTKHIVKTHPTVYVYLEAASGK
jgi:hypothetical protein